jgi:hypothetical protein
MIRVVFLLGAPATGKTTITLRVLQALGTPGTNIKFHEVWGRLYPDARVIVLGKYDGSIHSGTDKLALHTQPQAIQLLQKLNDRDDFDGWHIFIEGDRYANASFITAVQAFSPLALYALDVSPESIIARHALRSDRQNASWVAGRVTKVSRLRTQFGPDIIPNHVLGDIELAASRLVAAITSTPECQTSAAS